MHTRLLVLRAKVFDYKRTYGLSSFVTDIRDCVSRLYPCVCVKKCERARIFTCGSACLRAHAYSANTNIGPTTTVH